MIAKLFAIMGRRVPAGYEDEHGFHYGIPAPAPKDPPRCQPNL
jgi:hypothetical protein